MDCDLIAKDIAKYNVEEAYKGVIPLHESVAPAHLNDFQHYETRLFNRYYCINSTQQMNLDTCFTLQNYIKNYSVTSLLHLSHRHSILQEQQRIKRIIFSQREVKIMKHEPVTCLPLLLPGTLLCTIYMEDLTSYQVHIGIKGALIEINPAFKKNPNLILEDPTSKGYLAIFISPTCNHLENLLTLKTKHEYDSIETF